MFLQGAPIRAVHIPRRKNPKKPEEGNVLSMGYGFVEFEQAESCKEALKRLQGSVLDGHSLELKVSRKKLDSGAPRRKAAAATAATRKKGAGQKKILVKNLAFEAATRDLRELFGAFGKLQSVRIPRKFDGTHRGFGFVEFVTPQEAKAAVEALTRCVPSCLCS